MRLFFFALAALLAASSQPGFAQNAWTAHTSMRRALAVAASGDSVVWTATTGGLFRYRIASGQTSRVTVADSLSGTDARAVAVDARRNRVWVGYGDGTLDVLNPVSGQIRALADIRRAERFGTRDIRRLVVVGDSVFVATGFGVVLYDPVRLEVRATYSQFGALAAGLPVNDVLVAPLPSGVRALWVAVEGGVAYAPLDGRNLQDPASWTVETGGLPSSTVRALAAFEGRIYAGTNAGLVVRSGPNGWQNLFVTGDAVYDLTAGTRLVGLRTFGAVVVEPGGAASAPGVAGLDQGLDLTRAGTRLFAASLVQGLVPLTVEGGTVTAGAPILPMGPYDNTFADLRFAEDGTLWTAGDGTTGGFYRLSADGQTWKSFTSNTVQGFPGGGVSVVPTDDGGAWGGTVGRGAVRIEPSGTFVLYGPSNSTLTQPIGVPSTDPYTEVRGIDREGQTIWAANRYAAGPLDVWTGGQWGNVPLAASGAYVPSYTGFNTVFVDRFGQKWITVLSELDQREGRGLIVLDTKGTPANPSDDRFRFFASRGSNGSGLPGLYVYAIDDDTRGRLWIGTDRGPAYLANTSVTAQDNTAQFVWPVDTDLQRYVLLGVRVNDVAVDPAGSVWCATNEGAFRIDERAGSFSVGRTFTAENSPMPSNQVLSVAVNPVDGEVFFATSGGLVSWKGGPQPPAPSVQALLPYPNPYRAAASDAPSTVTITGLVADAAVRILAPDGRLVVQLDGRGGSVEWDVRDQAGQPVPSGVYLIVAVGARGEGAAYGKIAVIR